ncbi:MAG: Dienelactone hydrolase family protein [uncultured Acidimicrobiales bacterium]|uniref:Dienelactone hydrolase family protein n=1 Tax=uncultured Acidimicrobiales bacterium TaxID=310071 RepID=A0A6J4INW9_9ACTN|nr:MAG: Dienelactone hydrolase family protein [uncultured Acidimicrobiales bacterium]
MGDIVEFPSNGTNGRGHFAPAAEGPETRPGIVVIQEWWGLVPHIRDVCERFAAEGFNALAPDLYRGETTTEPDEAGKAMMALNLDQAGRDMSGAVDFLRDKGNGRVGVVGFCMGGGLALVLATQRPDAVSAVAPFYGLIPWKDAQPDYSKLRAAVQGHYAAEDGWANPDAVRSLETTLRDSGVEVEMFIYPGADHAFFNDSRPEVYDPAAAELAWSRTIEFFRARLG